MPHVRAASDVAADRAAWNNGRIAADRIPWGEARVDDFLERYRAYLVLLARLQVPL